MIVLLSGLSMGPLAGTLFALLFALVAAAALPCFVLSALVKNRKEAILLLATVVLLPFILSGMVMALGGGFLVLIIASLGIIVIVAGILAALIFNLSAHIMKPMYNYLQAHIAIVAQLGSWLSGCINNLQAVIDGYEKMGVFARLLKCWAGIVAAAFMILMTAQGFKVPYWVGYAEALFLWSMAISYTWLFLWVVYFELQEWQRGTNGNPGRSLLDYIIKKVNTVKSMAS